MDRKYLWEKYQMKQFRYQFKLGLMSLIFLSFYSCGTILYLPTKQTIPLVTQENEVVVEASVSIINPLAGLVLEGNQSSYNASLTCAASDDIAIYVKGVSTINDVTKRRDLTLGIGYLGNSDSSELFQIYLLGSVGDIGDIDDTGRYFTDDWRIDVGVIKLLPQFIWRYGKSFRTTIVPSLRWHKFNFIEEEIPRSNPQELRFEPSISLQFGKRNKVNLEIEIGTSVNLGDVSVGELILYSYGSFGFSYCITCNR